MGNQGKISRKQGSKMYVFLHISVLISNLAMKHTVCGVTSFQGLPAFLSRSSERCGPTNFLRLKSNVLIKS